MNLDEISTIVYQPKNDHEPGFIYLMEAEGYHGFIPGAWLRRCKIGLSRNPEARLDKFHRNQPVNSGNSVTQPQKQLTK